VREGLDDEQESDVDGEDGGEGAPVPGVGCEKNAETEEEGDGTRQPWRWYGPCGGAWAARNEERGDDECEAGEACAEELHRRGDEAIALEGESGAGSAADEEEQGNDGVADAAKPGLFGTGGEERFDEGDGDRDTPEGVQVEHEKGPPRADVESGNPRVIEEMHLHLQVVGIEEGLGDKAFFDEGVGGTEEEDAGPSAAGAANQLANEEGRAAIHGREGDERAEHFDGQIAEEEFGYQGRGEEEGDGGRDASLGTGHTVVCGAGAVYTAALFANSFLLKRSLVAEIAVMTESRRHGEGCSGFCQETGMTVATRGARRGSPICGAGVRGEAGNYRRPAAPLLRWGGRRLPGWRWGRCRRARTARAAAGCGILLQ
jgi:hypothetical protein